MTSRAETTRVGAVQTVSGGDVEANLVAWIAVDIAPEPITIGRSFAALSYVLVDTDAFVLTANRLVALPNRESTLTIGRNQLEGTLSTAPLARITQMHHCLFTDNTCRTHGESRQIPTIGQIESRSITVIDNRLRSIGDLPTMQLQPGVERAIVMGNTSTGPIALVGAGSVPPDINLTL
jgi:hypothetical protein